MVFALYNKHALRLGHVWFATDENISALLSKKHTKADLLFIHGVNSSFIEENCTCIKLSSQFSLIKHLNDNKEELWNSFGKHLKSYIKRSQRENATVRFFENSEIDGDLLKTCAKLYEQMKAAKGIPSTFNYTLTKCYAHQNAIVIALAYVDHVPVGFSAYILDDTHSRAWLTAFAFREDEFDSQAVSRAHQLLEWETMCYCCDRGIKSYDFGGIDNFDNPNGIDKFKMSFAKEGACVTYDNYLVGVSPIGKAAIAGYNILKKLRG